MIFLHDAVFINHVNLPVETEYTIWDMFFVWGDTVIFSTALTLTLMMEQELMMQERFDQVYQVV